MPLSSSQQEAMGAVARFPGAHGMRDFWHLLILFVLICAISACCLQYTHELVSKELCHACCIGVREGCSLLLILTAGVGCWVWRKAPPAASILVCQPPELCCTCVGAVVFKGSHRSTMLISWDTCGPDAVPLPPDGMAKDTARLVYPRLQSPCASNTSIC